MLGASAVPFVFGLRLVVMVGLPALCAPAKDGFRLQVPVAVACTYMPASPSSRIMP